jgi:hypothetical protein
VLQLGDDVLADRLASDAVEAKLNELRRLESVISGSSEEVVELSLAWDE